jgi:Uma2 family endonuclease
MSRPAHRRHRHTYRDYLEHEALSVEKHEFLDGDIYAMAGGTPAHAALSVAVSTLLSTQLVGRPCRVFSSDLRVRVMATGLATYPDVSVVCGDLVLDPESPVTVTNPIVLVEVASDATAEWDRTEKLEHYQQIPSLRECVIVSHRQMLLEAWRRLSDGSWHHQQAKAGETLRLESLGCALVVNDVYGRAGVSGLA